MPKEFVGKQGKVVLQNYSDDPGLCDRILKPYEAVVYEV